jgi:hypothetical protein
LVEDLDAFPYLDHVDNIPDSESLPLPPLLPQTETYPGSDGPLSEYLSEPWECGAHGCLETKLQNNPYYLFAMSDEYNHIQCGIKINGMMTYYENVLKEENTALRFPSFKTGDRVQLIVSTMQDTRDCGVRELHTLEDMRWNDNHQCPIKFWS